MKNREISIQFLVNFQIVFPLLPKIYPIIQNSSNKIGPNKILNYFPLVRNLPNLPNSLFRLFWTVFTFSMFRDGIQSKFTRFIEGDRHWIVKRGDNVVKTYGICKNLSNPVPIPSFQKRHLFKIC
jgi:hypothetical protein